MKTKTYLSTREKIVSLASLALLIGIILLLKFQTSSAYSGLDTPISTTDPRFFTLPAAQGGRYPEENIWGWTNYTDHVNAANLHSNNAVFYQYNDPATGTYYRTANMGNDNTPYGGVLSNAVVHCPTGIAISGPHNAHLFNSPSLSGMYDGPSHYWCGYNSAPLPGPIPGNPFPDIGGEGYVALIKTSISGQDYYTLNSTGNDTRLQTLQSSNGGYVQCSYTMAGPYGSSTENGVSVPASHYHCLNSDGSRMSNDAIVAGQAPPVTCTLTTDKTTYTTQESVSYTYSCSRQASTVTIQILKGDGTSVYQTTNNNSLTYSSSFTPFSMTVPVGTATLRICVNDLSCQASSVVSVPLTIIAPLVTSPGGGSETGPTLSGTIYKNGQFIDPATNAVRTCSSPNGWMKEGTLSGGARGFHCMPNYTSNATDTPPAACNGTLWAGFDFQSDVCAVTQPTGTVTPPAACSAGQTYCAASGSSPAGCYTTCPTGGGGLPPPPPPGTSTSCTNGARCPSGSWCQNGSQCYYPNGDITCVAWPASANGIYPMPGSAECPSGTSGCSPTDTNCVAVGQVVPYVSGKWCRNGDSYYSTDGKNMTCVRMGAEAPAGYTSCRPDDRNCIPRGSYGSSDGWCSSSSQQCYQKTSDNNSNNDKYCAPMTPGPGASEVSCPSGYSVCSPSDTNCFAKGDTIPKDKTNNAWCSSSQKCTLSDGSGICAGWNESCPAGSKFCSSNDTYCIEPGEYKTITNTGSSYGGSYWCGGGSGMAFYSATQAYCAPKKSGTSTTMMMWTAADIKAILQQLGSGWGLCSTNNQQCIEPGKSGPSSGWCAWWPPMSGGYGPAMNGSVQRTCPSLDGDTTPPPPEKPPVVCPVFFAGPKCLPGEVPEMVNGCQTGSCVKDPDWKPIICPTITAERTSCPAGQVLKTKTTPDGCSFQYCVDERMVPPIPEPEPFPGGDKDIKFQIFSLREELRGYRQMVSGLQSQTKDVPELKEIVDQAVKAIDEMKVLLVGGKYDKTTLEKVRTKMEAFRQDILPQLTSPEIRVYSEARFFVQELTERIKHLKNDIERHGDSETAKELSDLLASFEDLLEDAKQAAKDGDVFLLDDVRERRQALEESVRDIYETADQAGRRSFVMNAISELRASIADARAEIEERDLSENENCRRAQENMIRVLGIAADAEAAYNGGNEKTAAELLDKAYFFRDPTFDSLRKCGIRIEVTEIDMDDISDIYLGTQGTTDAIIERIVNKVLDKVQTQFQTLLDEQVKALTEAVAQLQTVATEKITASLAAVQKLDEDIKQEILTVKETIVQKVQETEALLKQVRLSQADLEALKRAQETAITYNWCGSAGTVITDQTESIATALETKDITHEDVANYADYVNTLASTNARQCYDSGVSRFPDTPLHEWYAQYSQGQSKIFKGRIVDGVPYFEPARNVSRAEALVAIMRTARENGLETGPTDGASCLSPVPVPSSLSWTNCSVAASARLDYLPPFVNDLGATASREDIALMMNGFFGENYFPVDGDSITATAFSDDNTRNTDVLEAVGTVVENQIMVGRSDTVWGFGQPITRAELAAVIERARNILSVTGTSLNADLQH